METEDYAEAIDEAVLTFWSGLTFEERWDAAHSLDVVAHPNFLPQRSAKRTESETARIHRDCRNGRGRNVVACSPCGVLVWNYERSAAIASLGRGAAVPSL